MLIREIERPVPSPLRGGDNNPLRRTAKELGVFLDRLTVAVRGALDKDGDTVDDALQAKSRGVSRKFKMPFAGAGEALLSIGLSEELAAALPLLKEARGLAAAAATPRLPIIERADMQARFESAFSELAAMPAAGQLQLTPDSAGGARFTLLTPDTSREAYRGIDALITKAYDIGTLGEGGAAGRHETAIDASKRMVEFLLGEGPAKAFARFRDIDRSNVLGLLK